MARLPVTGPGWTGQAAVYADTFARLCAGAVPALVEAAEVETGDLAVDVGCGTGAAAVMLRDRGTTVVAIDPAADMTAEAARHGLVVARGALPHLPLPDHALDVAVANFVVNHLPDPRAGMRELTRVTRRRVAVTIWPPTERMSNALVAAAFDRVGVRVPAGERLPAHLDFPRSVDGLGALAEDAGLRDVASREVAWTWQVSPADLWRGTEAGLGVRGRVLQGEPPEVRAALAAAFHEAAAAMVDGQGLLRLTETAVLAAGRVG